MSISVGSYLAWKEMWRNRGRFFLVSLVIALITLLVIFLAGLAEGLGAGNKEYLSKLGGELVVYQDRADLTVSSSQLGRSILNKVRRTEGVADAGPVGTSAALIGYDGAPEPESVSLIGVEPGRPGEPPVVDGEQLSSIRAKEAIIGRNVALRTGLGVGDTLVVESTQGTVDELYPLQIVGVSDGQQYFLQPSVIVPLYTWDRIRPKGFVGNNSGELTFNVVNVAVENPLLADQVARQLEADINNIEVVDRVTAYENAPGYSEQQSTLNTQRAFTLLIGILVVGGFFQIQTLQKVGQVGMLKALGAPNFLVAVSATIQIVTTNVIGVLLGVLATFGLAAAMPAGIPIIFNGTEVAIALLTLLIIGPLGGLVSIRYLTRVEPLAALG
ncbi:MAG: ABC transporter permease [Candidatus Promineifilaceae bacterium]|jgi:putative ABC transport system permease protein